jgi:hypothetical protein
MALARILGDDWNCNPVSRGDKNDVLVTWSTGWERKPSLRSIKVGSTWWDHVNKHVACFGGGFRVLGTASWGTDVKLFARIVNTRASGTAVGDAGGGR